MRKSLLGCVLLVLATACCTGRIKEDQSKSAIDANYMTAEMLACGERYFGLGVCYAPYGGEIKFSVQGVYKGQMRVVSTGCAVDETFTYAENELVTLSYRMQNRRCLFGITMTPDFPRSIKGSTVIYGLRGLIAFRAEEGDTYFADYLQTVEDRPSAVLEVPVASKDPVQVTLGGCGQPISRLEATPANGIISLQLKDYVNLSNVDVCVLDGYVLSEEDDITVTGLYTRFSSDFSPLAIPEVVMDPKSKRLTVNAPPSTGVVALDSRIEIEAKACFKDFDSTVPHVLRLYTSKGRSVIGEWNPQEGEWIWMN
jgi:hypothetical protein